MTDEKLAVGKFSIFCSIWQFGKCQLNSNTWCKNVVALSWTLLKYLLKCFIGFFPIQLNGKKQWMHSIFHEIFGKTPKSHIIFLLFSQTSVKILEITQILVDFRVLVLHFLGQITFFFAANQVDDSQRGFVIDFLWQKLKDIYFWLACR